MRFRAIFSVMIILLMTMSSVIAPYDNTADATAIATDASGAGGVAADGTEADYPKPVQYEAVKVEPINVEEIISTLPADPDQQFELLLRKCIDYYVKQFGISYEHAKEKCYLRLQKQEPDSASGGYVQAVAVETAVASSASGGGGGMVYPQQIYEKPEIYDEDVLRKKYTTAVVDDDVIEAELAEEIEFTRPVTNIGYSMPSIKGNEDDYIKGWILEKVHEEVGDAGDLFEHYCDNPEELVVMLEQQISSVFGGYEGVCQKLEEKAKDCQHRVETACNFGHDGVNSYAVQYSCPPDQNEIVELCIRKMNERNENMLQNAKEYCMNEWSYNQQFFQSECLNQQNYNRICNYEEFMRQCEGETNPNQGEKCQREGGYCIHWEDECKEGYQGIGPVDCPQGRSGQCCVPKYDYDPTNDPKKDCEMAGGRWREFSDGCGDSCALLKGQEIACTMAMTMACDCGSDKCWDGQRCVPNPVTDETNTEPIVGGDRDEHGCIPSAGYTWCESKQKCLRTWEEECPSVDSTTNYDDTGDATVTADGSTLTGNAILTGKVNYDADMNVVSVESTISTGPAYYPVEDCETKWQYQKRECEKIESLCSQDDFIEMCIEQKERDVARFKEKVQQTCREQAEKEYEYAKRHCENIEERREQCLETEKQRCAEIHDAVQKCHDFISSGTLREEIKEKVTRACKLRKYEPVKDEVYEEPDETGEEEGEGLKEVVLALSEDITPTEIVELNTIVQELQESSEINGVKIYKGLIEPYSLDKLKSLPYVVDAKYNTVRTIKREQQKPQKMDEYIRKSDLENVLRKILAMKQSSDMPEEFAPIIDAHAEDLIEVSEDLDEIEKNEEEKGFTYKFRMFLGLAKEAEQAEIEQIRNNKDKLDESIAELEALMEEIPDLTAKATLQSQIETLEQQKEDLEELMAKKEKKAKGWLNFLFG